MRCHSGSARELYLYHRSYREVTFGIWVSETVDFTSLRTPGPVTRIFMVGEVGDFTLQSMGWTKRNFPSYRSPGFEVKCTISGQCGKKVNWSKSTGLGETVTISLY